MPKAACLSVLFVGAGLLFPGTTDAAQVDDCDFIISTLPATLAAPGVYCLERDLATGITKGYAVHITHPRVTLDCGGFWISGLPAGIGTQTVGIRAEGQSRLIIRDCGVRGFQTGVRLVHTDLSIVEANHLEQIRSVAIQVQSPSDLRNTVRRNRIFDVGGSPHPELPALGIQVGNTDVRDNIIDGVTPTASEQTFDLIGIRSDNSERGVRISGNTVRNLLPAADGWAFGVLSYGGWAFVENNHLALPAHPYAVAIMCNGLGCAERDNIEWRSGSDPGGAAVD